jgi:hypothetical protein
MSENAASTRADEWLTVPQATAHLGISEKTLRRRIKSGALESQKNPKTDGGGTVLLVRVNGVPVTTGGETVNAPDSVPVTFKSEPDNVPVKSDGVPVNSGSVTGARAGHFAGRAGHEMDSVPVTAESDARVLAAENEILREALQRERENADQWRAQVEAANRHAAESAAALREALRAMPKQITGEYSQSETSAQNDLEPSKSGAAGKATGAQKNAPERKPAREFARTLRRLLGIR